MKKMMKKALFVVLALAMAIVSFVSLDVKANVANLTKDELIAYDTEAGTLLASTDPLNYAAHTKNELALVSYAALSDEDKAAVDTATSSLQNTNTLAGKLLELRTLVSQATHSVMVLYLDETKTYADAKSNIKSAEEAIASIYGTYEKAASGDLYESIKDIAFGDDKFSDAIAAIETIKTTRISYCDEILAKFEAKVEAQYTTQLVNGKLDKFFANKAAIEEIAAEYADFDNKGLPYNIKELGKGVKVPYQVEYKELTEGLETSENLIKAAKTAIDALKDAINTNLADVVAAGTDADGIYAANVKTTLEAAESAIKAAKEYDSTYNAETDTTSEYYLDETYVTDVRTKYDALVKQLEDCENAYGFDQKDVEVKDDAGKPVTKKVWNGISSIDNIATDYPAVKALYDALCPNQKADFAAKEITPVATVGKDTDTVKYDFPIYPDNCAFTELKTLADKKAYLEAVLEVSDDEAQTYDDEITDLTYEFTYAFYAKCLALKADIEAEPACVQNQITLKETLEGYITQIKTDAQESDQFVADVTYSYADDQVFGYDEYAAMKPSHTDFDALSAEMVQFMKDNADKETTDYFYNLYEAYQEFAEDTEVYEVMKVAIEDAEAKILPLIADASAETKSLVEPTIYEIAQFIDDFDAAKDAIDALPKGTTDVQKDAYDLTADASKLANYDIYDAATKVYDGYVVCDQIEALFTTSAETYKVWDNQDLTALVVDMAKDAVATAADVKAAQDAYDALDDDELDVVSYYHVVKLNAATYYLNHEVEAETALVPFLNDLVGDYAIAYMFNVMCENNDYAAMLATYQAKVIARVEELIIANGYSTIEELLNDVGSAAAKNAIISNEVMGVQVNYLDAAVVVAVKDAVAADPDLELADLADALKGFYPFASVKTDTMLAASESCDLVTVMKAMIQAVSKVDVKPANFNTLVVKYLSSAFIPTATEVASTDYDDLKFITVDIPQTEFDLDEIQDFDGDVAKYIEAQMKNVYDYTFGLIKKMNADIVSFIDDYNDGKFDQMDDASFITYLDLATDIEETYHELDIINGDPTVVNTQKYYIENWDEFDEIYSQLTWKYYYGLAATDLANTAKAGYFTVEGWEMLNNLKSLYLQASDDYKEIVYDYYTNLYEVVTPAYEAKVKANALQSYDTLKAELEEEITKGTAGVLGELNTQVEKLAADVNNIAQKVLELTQGAETLAEEVTTVKNQLAAALAQVTPAIEKLTAEVAANAAAIKVEAQARADADAAEKAAREAADAAEVAAREAADAAEVAARKEADAAEVAAREAAINQLKAQIEQLATDYKQAAADYAAAEEAARKAADATEEAARIAADAAEEKARKEADAAESTARQNADEAEATERYNADQSLQSQINELNKALTGSDNSLSSTHTVAIIGLFVAIASAVGVIVLIFKKKSK